MNDLRKKLELIFKCANINLVKSKSIDSINEEEASYIDFTLNTLIIAPVSKLLESPLLDGIKEPDTQEIMNFIDGSLHLMVVMKNLIPELEDKTDDEDTHNDEGHDE